jgi:hypothetical protein
MELEVLVSRSYGPHRVTCRTCAQPMRLVGIEPHPNIPDLVDLVTYECACGKLAAYAHLAEEAVTPANDSSLSPSPPHDTVIG